MTSSVIYCNTGKSIITDNNLNYRSLFTDSITSLARVSSENFLLLKSYIDFTQFLKFQKAIQN